MLFSKGSSLLITAIHECGHALGLDHSEGDNAIMKPIYPPFKPDIQLDKDDVAAIQSLYGTKRQKGHLASPGAAPLSKPGSAESANDNYPTESPPASDDEYCSNNNDNLGTFVRLNPDQMIYNFKEDKYVKYNMSSMSIEPGYPRDISQDFVGLEPNIDAAFPFGKKANFFFKGERFWKFEGAQMAPGYPKEIKCSFRNFPSGIEAAFEQNNNVYVFKGLLNL